MVIADLEGEIKNGPLSASPSGSFDIICRQCRFQAPRLLGGGQNSKSSCLGNSLCTVVDTESAIDIAGVDLDRVQKEVKPGGDFLIGQPFGDELEHFKFSFRFNHVFA